MLIAYVLWSVALCWGLVLRDGEAGCARVFVLPAVLFTVALVIFPTFFGLYIAFTDWNLQSAGGQQFNGLDNFWQLIADPYFWNALGNMVFYVGTVLVQYAIAFGLALLLNADIKAQKFFRVAFLLPFMLSPVAVSWMIGKSMLEYRFGPVTNLLRELGWSQPTLLTSPWLAKSTIALMDAWVWIPFMMIMILAGLQALPKDVQEAAKVDGATGWQGFWQITFPLMLPVSRHHHRAAHHLPAEARRHRDQHHGGRPGRGHRHDLELHLPRLQGPLQRRLWHDDRRGLSHPHHHLRGAAAEVHQPLHAEGRVTCRMRPSAS